jgi:hypothetical protein
LNPKPDISVIGAGGRTSSNATIVRGGERVVIDTARPEWSRA